jgi:hypothetical protein
MGYSRADSLSLFRPRRALDILGFCRRRFDLLAIKRLASQSCWMISLIKALQLFAQPS